MTGEFVARGGGMGASLVGVALLGRYQVQERIGDGGMGTVYLAEHTTILKKFAVKVLSPELSVRPDHVDRFMREARSASMINHPNVVEITDFGMTPDGQPFFVMEYLQGKDLSQIIGESGSLPWKRVRNITIQLCHALQAAHDQGVIHRDMKPGNILLVKRGNNPEHVKVLDFGIAKVLGQEGEANKGLTQSGMVVGTPEYMSPEQGWGQPVDHRGDIYALGVLMYELLTGKIPFPGATMMEILNRHMFDVPDVKQPNIPEEVGAIILKAMQKDRSLRFQSMNELAAAVEAVGTGASPVTVVDEEIRTPWGPVTARFAAVPPPQAQPRSWMWLSVLSAVIAVGALVFAMLPDAPDATPQAVVQAPPVAAPPSEPEVAPKQVVLAPEVEKVNFKISTDGVAAQILDARDEGIYGMTNDENGVMVQKSDAPIELILRAKGYEDHRFTIIPSQDKRFDKTLVALKAGGATTPSKPRQPPRDNKPPAKQDAPAKVDTKPAAPEPDDGAGSDLKNPFGKR